MKLFNVFFKILLIIFSTSIITGCLDTGNNLVPKDEYDNINGYHEETIGQKSYFELFKDFEQSRSKTDTAFLGFIFNVSKKQTEKLLNSKIRDSLISEWRNDSSFEYILDGSNSRQRTVPKRGYFYKFYMPNKMYVTGILNFHYDNDSLTAIRYQFDNWPDLDSLRNFLATKFGKPIIDTSFIEKYETGNRTTLYTWLIKSKEIQLVSQSNPHRIWLQYNSIGKAFAREKSFFDEVLYEKERRVERVEQARKRDLQIKKQADTILKVF